MTPKIEALITKIKDYPNYITILSEMSGYSRDYIQRMFNGKRKFKMDLIEHMLKVSRKIDRMEREIDKATLKQLEAINHDKD